MLSYRGYHNAVWVVLVVKVGKQIGGGEKKIQKQPPEHMNSVKGGTADKWGRMD